MIPEAAIPAGLRERKKAEARAAIVQAALDLYAERGFDNVTIDQIAEQAGVARRTYFRYFATKEAAVLDRRSAQLEKFKAMMAEAPLSATAIDVLREALRVFAAQYRADRARILVERSLFARSKELSGRDMQLDRDFEDVIADVVLARAGRTPSAMLRARMFAAAAMGVMRVLLDEWASGDGDFNLVKTGEPLLISLAELAPPHKPRAKVTQ